MSINNIGGCFNNTISWLTDAPLKLLSIITLMLLSFYSVAETGISPPNTNDTLQVKVYQQNNETFVPNQQVIVLVEILSASPFSKDFTLPYLDFDNTVVVQPDAKSELDTQFINEQQWFIQRKKIIIYPLQAGQFTIPSLAVTAYLNDEKNGQLVHDLNTQPYSFSVSLPDVFNSNNTIIASSHVRFSANVTRNPKNDTDDNSTVHNLTGNTGYSIGSAISYRYTIKADNTHIIMLKKLAVPEIEGVQIYRKPSVEKDEFDRFEKFNTAILTQTFTFIFQQQGQFTIPEQTLFWWDTVNKELKQETVKAQTFIVGSGSVQSSIQRSEAGNLNSIASLITKLNAQITVNHFLLLVLLLVVVVLTAVIIIKAITHRRELIGTFHQYNKTTQKQLCHQFIKQIEAKDYQSAISSLYQLSFVVSNSTSPLVDMIRNPAIRGNNKVDPLSTDARVLQLQKLQKLAFNTNLEETQFTLQDAQEILNGLINPPHILTRILPKHTPFKFSLKLNP